MELDPQTKYKPSNYIRRLENRKRERERERKNGRKIINRAPVRRKVNDKETAR